MERRNFLKALACVPAAPVLLRGMSWAALEQPEANRAKLYPYSAEVPPGTILPWVGKGGSDPKDAAPPGFLPCDGRAVPTFMYRRLHSAIGDAYGIRTRFRVRHFCVPDLRASARPAAALAYEKKYSQGTWSPPNYRYVIRT